MGSKVKKSLGNSSQTKVKNRSKHKVFQIPRLNGAKAQQIYEKAKQNGFTYGDIKDLLENSNSLRSFRKAIGSAMTNRHDLKKAGLITKDNK